MGAEGVVGAEPAGGQRPYNSEDWYWSETFNAVSCPVCAFTFSADHVDDATNLYTCPCCEERRLYDELDEAWRLIAALSATGYPNTIQQEARRRMAAREAAASRQGRPMKVPTDLSYCVAHHGFIDSDQEVCDFARMDDEVTECVSRPLFYEDDDPAPAARGES